MVITIKKRYGMEKWKTIEWRSLYEVSNKGRVRNKKTKHILTTNPTKSHRHPQVWLYSNIWGATEQFTLSRIVYNAFCNVNDRVHWCYGIGKGDRIGHKDGNIFNNEFNNLFKY